MKIPKTKAPFFFFWITKFGPILPMDLPLRPPSPFFHQYLAISALSLSYHVLGSLKQRHVVGWYRLNHWFLKDLSTSSCQKSLLPPLNPTTLFLMLLNVVYLDLVIAGISILLPIKEEISWAIVSYVLLVK